MFEELTGGVAGASGNLGGVSTWDRGVRIGKRDSGNGNAAAGRAAKISRLDPSLSDQEQTRRHAIAPIDKAGALTKAQREAWWFFRDLVQAASDKGVSREQLAEDIGCEVGYLNGMLASGDKRAPSAGHFLGLLMSGMVPEGAKRIVLEQMGVVAGVLSHTKGGGLGGKRDVSAADEAMKVGAETGDLARAIADAVDDTSDGGRAITPDEAREIRREAGEAAAACDRAGAILGRVLDIRG